MTVKRIIGSYLALAALAVAAQFVAYPFYAYDSGGDAMDAAVDTGRILNWLMAAGLVLMLITTFMAKQKLDTGSSADTRQWIGATSLFYGTVLLALAFVPNWFEVLGEGNDDSTIWHLTNTALPVLFAVQARRLLRTDAG